MAQPVVVGVLLLAGGCATPKRPTAEPSFFPSPPADPRLQYLVSFSRPEDFESPQNALMTFLIGRRPPRMALVKPYGLSVHGGRIFVCDSLTGTIHILGLKEKKWTYFTPTGPGRLQKPIHVAVSDDRTRYVADTLRGRVMVYADDGSFLNAIGEGTSMKPVDVLASEDRLYVADLADRTVRVLDRTTYEMIRVMPAEAAESEEQKLFAPTNLALGPEGHLYVSDTGGFRVQQYDAEGRHVRALGRHGDAPGEFARNKGIAVDREGRIYVVDAASEAVQIFDRQGELLLFFGNPITTDKPLVLPAAIAIDYDHVDYFRSYAAADFALEYIVLVISQYGDRKLSIYGFGHSTAVAP